MKTSIILAVVASVVLGGCASLNPWSKPDASKAETARVVTTGGVINAIPDWFLKNPESAEYIYVTGTGSSRDLSMSVQKAHLDAQNKAADRINGTISSFMKQYKQDTANDYRENTELMIHKLVAEVQTGGYEVTNSLMVPEGGNYRSYVQLRYSYNDIMRQMGKAVNPRREQNMNAELDRRITEKRAVEN